MYEEQDKTLLFKAFYPYIARPYATLSFFCIER